MINLFKFLIADLDEYLDDFYKSNEEESKLPQYIDYVKGLLLSSGIFALDSDPFPCTDIDPTKQYVILDGDSAIKICDLCPFFPFEKLTNLFLNTNASFIWPNTVYIECVANCLDQSSCVALSYDSEEKVCYGFDSTEAETFDEFNYTTVVVTQPKGMIRDWLYSRNTKLAANSTRNFTTTSFIECLSGCSKDGLNGCKAISYEYSTKTCLFFNVMTFDRVDYAYGHLAALNLNITQDPKTNRWRFSLYNNLIDEQTEDTFTSEIPTEGKVKRKFIGFEYITMHVKAKFKGSIATTYFSNMLFQPDLFSANVSHPLTPLADGLPVLLLPSDFVLSNLFRSRTVLHGFRPSSVHDPSQLIHFDKSTYVRLH